MKEYTPQELAVKGRKLALEYNQKMKELAELKKRKAMDIIELVAEHKAVTRAELVYNATEDGQKIIEIELYCKGLIELIRSIKSEVNIKQSEAFGNF